MKQGDEFPHPSIPRYLQTAGEPERMSVNFEVFKGPVWSTRMGGHLTPGQRGHPHVSMFIALQSYFLTHKVAQALPASGPSHTLDLLCGLPTGMVVALCLLQISSVATSSKVTSYKSLKFFPIMLFWFWFCLFGYLFLELLG